MKLTIYNHVVGLEESDPEKLMKAAGLDFRLGFEAIGIQDDGTPVVFDKCGAFGYLDANVYRVRIDLGE